MTVAFWRQVVQMDDKYTKEDEWIPMADGRELARRMSTASFTPVPDAKHLVQEDAPEAIVAAALRLWAAVDR